MAILSEVTSFRGVRPRQISREGAKKLKQQINAAVALARSRQKRKMTRVPPHQWLADLERTRLALKAALDCLDTASEWLQNAVDEEILTRVTHIASGQYVDGQGDALTVEIARHNRHVTHNVEGTCESLKFVYLCLEAHEASLRRYQETRKSKERPRRPNFIRYMLVAELARVFEETFRKPPKASVTGPWCSFLAHVLSCCEVKPVDPGNALRLWNNARNMRLHEPKMGELIAVGLVLQAHLDAGVQLK